MYHFFKKSGTPCRKAANPHEYWLSALFETKIRKKRTTFFEKVVRTLKHINRTSVRIYELYVKAALSDKPKEGLPES